LKLNGLLMRQPIREAVELEGTVAVAVAVTVAVTGVNRAATIKPLLFRLEESHCTSP